MEGEKERKKQRNIKQGRCGEGWAVEKGQREEWGNLIELNYSLLYCDQRIRTVDSNYFSGNL